MTQHQEELLWKYIDGLCTDEEIVEVFIIMNDPAIQEEYSAIEELHQALHEQELTTAPDDLIQKTMKGLLQQNPKLSIVPPMHYTPLLFLLGLVFSSTLLVFLLPMSKSTDFSWLSDSALRITEVQIDLSIFASLNNMGIALLAILCLVIMDQVLLKKRLILSF